MPLPRLTDALRDCCLGQQYRNTTSTSHLRPPMCPGLRTIRRTSLPSEPDDGCTIGICRLGEPLCESLQERTVVLGNFIMVPIGRDLRLLKNFEGGPLDFTSAAPSADSGLSDSQSSPARAQANADGIAPKMHLCDATLVPMMEATDFWRRNSPPCVRRLDRARNWRVLLRSRCVRLR